MHHRAARFLPLLLASALCCAPALAQEPAPEADDAPAQTSPAEFAELPISDDITTLDTVVVSGAAQGPGLWLVTDAQGHQLWVLATLTPIPATIEWNAQPTLERVDAAQEILWEPRFKLDVDVGFFGKIGLGLRYKRAERNPDGKTLHDLLPEATYQRWQRLRQRYLPSERSLDNKRPLIAAQRLMNAAVRASGLRGQGVVRGPIRARAQANGIREIQPEIDIEFSAATARAIIADVRGESLRDVECMAATLDAIEQDLPRMITNANAWALGELERIQFDQLQRRERLCLDVFTDNRLAERYGLPDVLRSIRERWLLEAKAALARNQTTVAVVALNRWWGEGGYLNRLQTEGYDIQMP